MKFNLLLLLILFSSTQSSAQSWEWLKQAGGIKSDKGNTIVTDTEGNIFITGYYNEEANFGSMNTGFSFASSKEVFVAKLNPNGDFLWVKNGLNYFDDRGLGLCTDPAGNVFVTGTCWGGLDWDGVSSYSPSAYTDQIFITKLDTDGNLVWIKNAGFDASGYPYNDDHGQDIESDALGNLFITGFLSNNTNVADFAIFDAISVPIEANDSIAFIAKMNNDGDWQWVETFDGIVGYRDNGLGIDGEGNAYIAGGFKGTAVFDTETLVSTNNTLDIFVAKYDTDGNFIFVKQVADSLDARADQITYGYDGHMYVTGEFRDEVLFGTDDLNNYGSPGDKDLFVSKLNTNGNWIWATKAGSKKSGDRGMGICANDQGNIFVSGQYRGDAKFGDIEVTNGPDSTQLFVALIDSTGEWRWVLTGGGPFNDRAASIAVDSDCNLYTTGFFKGEMFLDTLSLTSYGVEDNDIFIAKIADPCKGFDEEPEPPFNPEVGEEYFHFKPVNVFSPNGDGINDLLVFCEYCNIESEIVILNRWGNIMHTSKDLTKGWDGKGFDGKPAATGTYFYRVIGKYTNGETEVREGFFELRRK